MVIGINTRDQLNEEDEIQRRLMQISTAFLLLLVEESAWRGQGGE